MRGRKPAVKGCCKRAASKMSDSSDSDSDNECCMKAAAPKRSKMKAKAAISESDSDKPVKKCPGKKSGKAVFSDSDKTKVSDKSHSSAKKQYDLMTLLHAQNFTGYWENLAEINAMLGLNVSKIDGVDVADEKIANKCVATILALAALHVKSMNQKNLWTMIEKIIP